MMTLRYFASVFIWQFLNPFGIWQSILQNGGQALAILRSRVSKSAVPHIRMSLPFSGYWTVVNGGLEPSDSHSWHLITQRYAYDFIFSGKDGKKYKGNNRTAEQHYGFGRDVLAPADGIVVKVQNKIRDRMSSETGSADILTSDFRGNHLIIRHSEHVYSFIAHLQKNSCTVKPGDSITRGQVIGKCGNSGHSTEPHIHFHIQDRPNFYLAVGLPVLFQNIQILFNDSRLSEKMRVGTISRNCKVRNFTPDDKLSDEVSDVFPEGYPAKGQSFYFIVSILNALGLIVWLIFIYILLIQPLINAAKLVINGG